MPTDVRRIERALLSVSDKTGLADLARALHGRGVALVSTGGTRRHLAEAGLPVIEVADVTGFPELMDGRLKTLHPAIHGGLLAIRENPVHEAAMLAHDIPAIDLLVVNLYPFESTARAGAGRDAVIEAIDIGGPAMIRAAAKNHADVAVAVDPGDYPALLAEIDRTGGGTSAVFRAALAQTAFMRTAAYDAAIAHWLDPEAAAREPRHLAFGGVRAGDLRYGENPHQRAGFYATLDGRPGVGGARLAQGKPLSFNNIGDADAAFELVAEFDPATSAAVAIIKHANPCGVGLAASGAEAYRKALRCDPTSAFGGIVALNRALDREAASEIAGIFTEAIVAPAADAEALAILAGKPKLRVLLTGGLPDPRSPGVTWRSVAGGFLVQERDAAAVDALDVVTRRGPTSAELEDLVFAQRVAKHVRSNAIVLARAGATTGIGAGQMSRVDAVRVATWKAREAAREGGSFAQGSVLASDAFFPFADGLEAAAAAGVTATIQPGGSLRDAEVIAAADAAGMAMLFTGTRHFRH